MIKFMRLLQELADYEKMSDGPKLSIKGKLMNIFVEIIKKYFIALVQSCDES